MRQRLIRLPKNRSYFLFGARGTGKSTLLSTDYPKESTSYIDLLNPEIERRYLRNPEYLRHEIEGLSDNIKYVLIDEIQKIPALLDVVHQHIEKTDKIFILTGSSARKLKKGKANLLAGRAFVRHLFPFSVFEVGADFDLLNALNWGMLPDLWSLNDDESRADYLRAYAHTYLKEEIWAEHLIRKLEPFQCFLEVAAHDNGKIINTANIARDVGVDDKSIAQYFSILEDTLLGFHLTAFQHSFRKKLSHKPKFYFFDVGVVRALKHTVSVPINEATYDFDITFEHFIILECMKLASYFYPDYRFSYLKTHDGLEVDLIVERPGKPLLMIEIKSSTEIHDNHCRHLFDIEKEFKEKAEYYCFARVERALKINAVSVLPWQEGLKLFQGDSI